MVLGSCVLLVKPDEGLNKPPVRVTQHGICMGGDWMFQGEVVELEQENAS